MKGELDIKFISKWPVLKKIHQFIMCLDGDVEYRVFPIYIRYNLGDSIIAVFYFKGKFISDGQLIVGFVLKEKPKRFFVEAEDMKYKGINYYFRVNAYKEFSESLLKSLKF